jgi:hypothetical protein
VTKINKEPGPTGGPVAKPEALASLDGAASQAAFVIGLLIIYGVGYLITPWATLGAVAVILSFIISPSSNAPKLDLSPRRLRHLSFGLLAVFLLIGFTQIISDIDESELTPQEAAEIRQSNLAEIRKLESELRATPPEMDLINRSLYARLTQLDPGNAKYAAKAQEYQALVDKRQYEADHPEESLEVIESRITRGGFGSVALLDVTIKNNAAFTIRDPVITCRMEGESGTVIHALSATAYAELKSGTTKRISKVNMGLMDAQAVSSNCSVTAANR